mgnify:FL=1
MCNCKESMGCNEIQKPGSLFYFDQNLDIHNVKPYLIQNKTYNAAIKFDHVKSIIY